MLGANGAVALGSAAENRMAAASRVTSICRGLWGGMGMLPSHSASRGAGGQCACCGGLQWGGWTDAGVTPGHCSALPPSPAGGWATSTLGTGAASTSSRRASTATGTSGTPTSPSSSPCAACGTSSGTSGAASRTAEGRPSRTLPPLPLVPGAGSHDAAG